MRRYFASLMATFATLSLCFSVVLWLHDPFAIYAPDPDHYYAVHDYVRVVKPYWVARGFDGVLMGTSRSYRGFRSDDVNELFGDVDRAFNFGITGMAAYELLRYLQHSLALNQVRRVLVELNSFMVPGQKDKRQFSERRLAVGRDGRWNPFWRLGDLDHTLYSISALNRIVELYMHPDQPKLHRPDGSTNFGRRGAYRKDIRNDIRNMVSRRLGDELRTDVLGDVMDLLCERGIAADFFFAPVHSLYLESIERNAPARLAAIKTELVRVIERKRDQCHAPMKITIWDFMTYNAITQEPPAPPGEQMRYFGDPFHFTFRVGRQILRRLATPEAAPDVKGFGVQVSGTMLPDHFQRQKVAREAWLAARPEILKFLPRDGKRIADTRSKGSGKRR